jgi:hypothetical protein
MEVHALAAFSQGKDFFVPIGWDTMWMPGQFCKCRLTGDFNDSSIFRTPAT